MILYTHRSCCHQAGQGTEYKDQNHSRLLRWKPNVDYAAEFKTFPFYWTITGVGILFFPAKRGKDLLLQLRPLATKIIDLLSIAST